MCWGFGGFVLSAIKRDRGVKDWGWLIEGHGGMLDRVDSLSFAAPVFFSYCALLVGGLGCGNYSLAINPSSLME